jgi:aerobic-type carbon monoxide dehydrogenase small subunit (CoxS/CutS family)
LCSKTRGKECFTLSQINFWVNGQSVSVSTYPTQPLLDVLREKLYLTGAKECCGKGECGSCSVIINGEAVCSCLIMVGQVEGQEIQTVEGIGTIDKMDLLQKEFVQFGATQCGYCTPGIIVAAKAFLDGVDRVPTTNEIKNAMAGNLCRCTGYSKIIQAIANAAKENLASTKP